MSIHYVAQELPLAELNELVKPVDMVLRADVERVLLLEDLEVTTTRQAPHTCRAPTP